VGVSMAAARAFAAVAGVPLWRYLTPDVRPGPLQRTRLGPRPRRPGPRCHPAAQAAVALAEAGVLTDASAPPRAHPTTPYRKRLRAPNGRSNSLTARATRSPSPPRSMRSLAPELGR
jgi:hypothetical protein